MARWRRPRADASRLKYAADHTLMDTPFLHTNTTCAGSRATSIGWAFVAKATEPASSNTAPTTSTDLNFMGFPPVRRTTLAKTENDRRGKIVTTPQGPR